MILTDDHSPGVIWIPKHAVVDSTGIAYGRAHSFLVEKPVLVFTKTDHFVKRFHWTRCKWTAGLVADPVIIAGLRPGHPVTANGPREALASPGSDQEPGHSSPTPFLSIIPEPLEILLIDPLSGFRECLDDGIQSRLRRCSLMTAVVKAYDPPIVIEAADNVIIEPDFAIAVVFLQHLRVVSLEFGPRTDGRDHAGFNLAHGSEM